MRHLIFISMILFSCTSLAEDSVTQLDKQVISADQISIPELHSDFFSHQDFAGKYLSLSEFLQFNAGIQTRSSGIGNLVSLSIRGSSHQQIQFIVDGHEINDAQYGGFDINKLPLHQIQSIKIIKSNSNGIGGTIIIETIGSVEESETKAFLSVGSFDTYEYGFSQHFSGFGKSTISYSRLTSQANYEYPVPSPYLNPSNSGEIEDLNNNQYKKNSALYKWHYTPTIQSKIGLKLQYIYNKKNLPNYQQNRIDNEAYLSDHELIFQSFNEYEFNNGISNKVAFDHTTKNETFSDPQSYIGTGSFLNKYKTIINGFNDNLTYRSTNYSLSMGYHYKYESFQNNHTLVSDSAKCLNTTSTCDIASNQTSQSIEFNSDWINDKQSHQLDFNITALELSKEQKSLFSDPDKTTVTNTYLTWSSAYSYFGLEQSAIRFGISNVIRTPSLYETFGNRGLVKSNINLKPERSYNLNLNINNTYQEFTFENDFYYRDLTDAIVAQFSGGTGSYKNLSSAEIIGLESKITGYFRNFKASIIATIQDSLVKSEINGFDKKKLAGIFHNSFNANLIYSFYNHIEFVYQYQNDQGLYVDTANLEKHGGRETHNIRLNYSIENIAASISFENILDNRYKDQKNRPAAGLILNSNLQYTF